MDSPNGVQDAAMFVNPQIDVRQQDVVEVTFLLVLEEQIGHPDLLDLGQGQVFDAT